MIDNYIHLICKVKAVQKCQYWQLCVLRENSVELQEGLNPTSAYQNVTSFMTFFDCSQVYDDQSVRTVVFALLRTRFSSSRMELGECNGQASGA